MLKGVTKPLPHEGDDEDWNGDQQLLALFVVAWQQLPPPALLIMQPVQIEGMPH